MIENHFESGQLAERKIGDTLTAEFDYATCSANCLEEIVYRNNDDELVDGVRYHYDVDDSVKRRIEPFYDEQFADSFSYDESGRVDTVRYGADPVSNENPQREVKFLLDGVGNIEKKTVTDEEGKELTQLTTDTTPLHGYERFGDRMFGFDGNGNRTSQEGEYDLPDLGNPWEAVGLARLTRL